MRPPFSSFADSRTNGAPRIGRSDAASTPLADRIDKDVAEVRDVIKSPTASTAASTLGSSEGPGFDKDTMLVFDWDDTVLPTSWLQRAHLLSMASPMQPEMQRQVAKLVTACAQTLSLAASLGNVVFITNSAPGWVAESCELFMPQLSSQVKGIPIYAKPMSAPMTFKITTFQKECRSCRNLISIGDGNTERVATLSLRPNGDHGSVFQPSMGVDDEGRRLKSVKLIELPTCQELISQHEVLQARLLDIVAFKGDLDLKARFANESGFGLRSCSLIHMPGPRSAAGLLTFGAKGGSLFGGTGVSANVAPPASGSPGGARLPSGGGCVGAAAAAALQQSSAEVAGNHLPRLSPVRGRALSSRRPGERGDDHRSNAIALAGADTARVSDFPNARRVAGRADTPDRAHDFVSGGAVGSSAGASDVEQNHHSERSRPSSAVRAAVDMVSGDGRNSTTPNGAAVSGAAVNGAGLAMADLLEKAPSSGNNGIGSSPSPAALLWRARRGEMGLGVGAIRPAVKRGLVASAAATPGDVSRFGRGAVAARAV